MPTLDPSARRALRARAHHLDAVVSIGQHGLTPAVLHEIDVALKAHELIKVRVFGDDRQMREALMREVCDALGAVPVQHLGKLLVIFRENPEKPRATARRPRKAKPEHATPRATDQLRASTTTRRRHPQGAGRSVAPSGVPRAGLPRRRRARS